MFSYFSMCVHEESNLNYGIRNPVSYPLNDGRIVQTLEAEELFEGVDNRLFVLNFDDIQL